MLGLNYLDDLDERLGVLENEYSSIAVAAKLVVKAALRGGHFYVYDSMGAVSSEATGRAGGLFMVRKLRKWDVHSSKISPEDVVAFFTDASNIEGDVDLARELKTKGVKIIGVFPKEYNFRGKELFLASVDLIIDNALESKDGVVAVRGYSKKIGSIDQIINSTIVFCLCAEIVSELLNRKLEPSIYLSMRMFEADAHNRQSKQNFESRGY